MVKTLFTHPKNVSLLSEICKNAQEAISKIPDLHLIHGYEVVANPNIPATRKTGKIIYHDDKFTTYSDGPSSNMSRADYDRMCIYFGWARHEEEIIIFETNNSFINILELLDAKQCLCI